MADRRLVGIGIGGALIAAICCASPLLAVIFGALGLASWQGSSDYGVLALLLVSVALIWLGLSRGKGRRRPAPGHIRRRGAAQ